MNKTYVFAIILVVVIIGALVFANATGFAIRFTGKAAKATVIPATDEMLADHYPDSMAVPIAEKAKNKFESEGREFKCDLGEYGMVVVNQLRSFLKSSQNPTSTQKRKVPKREQQEQKQKRNTQKTT